MLFERLQFAEIKNNRNLRFVIPFFIGFSFYPCYLKDYNLLGYKTTMGNQFQSSVFDVLKCEFLRSF